MDPVKRKVRLTMAIWTTELEKVLGTEGCELKRGPVPSRVAKKVIQFELRMCICSCDFVMLRIKRIHNKSTPQKPTKFIAMRNKYANTSVWYQGSPLATTWLRYLSTMRQILK
ncbi:hypothetical protein AMTRI_Chr10g226780 [Amborella trichopoda]